MKKIIIILILCFTSFIVSSQDKIKGNGINTMVETKVDAFKKIILNNEFEVTLIESESARIEIETDENLHEEIEFNVIDSVLTVETAIKLRPKKKLDVTIFCTNKLNEVVLNDDSAITSLRTINANDFLLTIKDKAKANLTVKSNYFKLTNKNTSKLQLKSNSQLDIESPKADLYLAESANSLITLKSDSINVSLKKNAFLELKGNTNYAIINNNNNGDLKAKDFDVKSVNLTTSDHTKNEIKAIDEITIEAFDKSQIDLYGDPKIELNKFRNTSKLIKKELKIKK